MERLFSEEVELLLRVLPDELRTVEELLSLRVLEVPVLLLERREVPESFFTLLLPVPRELLLPVRVPEVPVLLPVLLLRRVLLLLVLVRELLLLVRELLPLLRELLLLVPSRRVLPVVEAGRLVLEELRRVVYTSSLFDFDGWRPEPGRMFTEPKSERRCVV